MKRILYILALALSIVACTEEIDKSNRYTFAGETVADFMLNRSEKYSHFITLLKRAELFSLLQTYGQYTLFLPDNEAVEKYIQEQDSIYHATKESDAPVWTGITSSLFEELSDSMANVIARTHLVEGNHPTTSFDDGALSHWNFYDRYLGISYEKSDESFHTKINVTTKIIDRDYEVENGIVHIVDNVIEVTNNTLPKHIEGYTFFSLFSEALAATHFGDSLQKYIDLKFKPLDKDVTPQKKFYKYTGFIETNEVFNNNGIYTLDDLKRFAEKWYGTEDRDNPCSPKNALYKFVAYHFVPRELTYNKIIPMQVGGYSLEELVVAGHDCYDYFETMLGRLMKVTKPLSSKDGLYMYINRFKENKVYNEEMRSYLNVRIIEPTEFTQASEKHARFNPIAMNGIIQPIENILIYDENEMAGNILNERMRFDFGTLLPELSCNNIRHITEYKTGINIPFSYCENIKNNSNASDFFEYWIFCGYMQDAFVTDGFFDVSFRLPPVPAKVYEVRLGVELLTPYLGLYGWLLQPYIDGKICSLPIDFPKDKMPVEWVDDVETLDNGVEHDKLMRSEGWMKGPDAFYGNNYISLHKEGAANMRESCISLRKIICRTHLPEGEHWIRFRLLREGVNPFHLDYIELVPLSIINDPVKPEDRH